MFNLIMITFMVRLENGRRQFHIYKCICTTSKSIYNPVYSRGRMVEIRHHDNDPNFLAKTQEFKDKVINNISRNINLCDLCYASEMIRF
jgi:hypothetical protein